MRLFRRRRPTGPTRQELIDRKHELEGEIRSIAGEVQRQRSRGRDVAELEAQMARLRDQHHQTRMQIDRTAP
jgi:hypothetical protein